MSAVSKVHNNTMFPTTNQCDAQLTGCAALQGLSIELLHLAQILSWIVNNMDIGFL